jgi:hypothetical protein
LTDVVLKAVSLSIAQCAAVCLIEITADVPADHRTCDSTDNGCRGFAVTTADLAADNTADDSTDDIADFFFAGEGWRCRLHNSRCDQSSE